VALFVAVSGDVLPGRMPMMLGCVQAVRVRQMRMVRGLLVIAGFVMLGGCVVMARGVFMMLRRLPMMVCCFQ